MHAKSPRIVQSSNSYFQGSKCTSMIGWFGVSIDFILLNHSGVNFILRISY